MKIHAVRDNSSAKFKMQMDEKERQEFKWYPLLKKEKYLTMNVNLIEEFQ
jgi:hypothetical protein